MRALAGDGLLHVRGRVMALRSTGGLSFLRLRDRTGEIQLLVERGDARATTTRGSTTSTSATSSRPRGRSRRASAASCRSSRARLRLVTKAYRPLPEKWHGLTDVELRYRQRYVDLVANPPVADVFRARSHIVRALRAILDEHGFLEVETPTMHTLIGGAAAQAVRDAPQRARHAPLHAHRAGALPEAPRRGRARARLRDRALLPQRGDQHAAQPRVHDARVLPGVRDVRRPDGLHRGAAPRRRRARSRAAMPAAHAAVEGGAPVHARRSRSCASRWTARWPRRRSARRSRSGSRRWRSAGGAALVELLRADFGEQHQGVGEVVAARQGARLGQLPQGPRQVRQRRRAPLRLLRVPGRAVPRRRTTGATTASARCRSSSRTTPSRSRPLARRNDARPGARPTASSSSCTAASCATPSAS